MPQLDSGRPTTCRSSPSSRFERRARRRPRRRRAPPRLADRDRRHSASSPSKRADADALAAFDAPAPADLLISGPRAATLKLANQREAVPTGRCASGARRWIDLDEATAIADPALDLADPLKGPFQHRRRSARQPAAAAALTPRAAARAAPGLLHRRRSAGARRGVARLGRRSMALDHGADLVDRVARQACRPASPSRPRSSPSAAAEDAAEHVALLVGAPDGRAAARPAPQRMPDRRRARLAQMRLRARSSTRRSRRWPRPAGASSSICARRGAASAWSTSCAPMRSRTRASTRSTPICGSASPTTSATSRSRRRCSTLLGQKRGPAAHQQSAQGGGAGGGRHPRRRAGAAARRGPTAHNAAYLETKKRRSGHRALGQISAASSSKLRAMWRTPRSAAAPHGRARNGGRRPARSPSAPEASAPARRPANPR